MKAVYAFASLTGANIEITSEEYGRYDVTADGKYLCTGGLVMGINGLRLPEDIKKKAVARIGNLLLTQKHYDGLMAAIMPLKDAADAKEKKLRAWCVPELESLLEARREHIYLTGADMERGYNTSIYKASKKTLDLEEKYPWLKNADEYIEAYKKDHPEATAYVRWTNMSPGSKAGFQAWKAAQALLEGATLEEAAKIADEWDKWD